MPRATKTAGVLVATAATRGRDRDFELVADDSLGERDVRTWLDERHLRADDT